MPVPFGQNDGAADLLVSVTGVDAELDVDFDGLVELGGGGLHDQIHGLGDVVLRAAVDTASLLSLYFLPLNNVIILLKVVIRNNPPTDL